ncbi:hypothetical protein LMG7974_00371 [Campylobacter majalis]|uniref:Copper resistance protein NlpE n=1 Tax=Campylobacter majalis TaxID=2790656 RepID=A0ABM8Q3N9_9BACT|nr:copper resistance protein NlpE [Campylobacter majalis]CAD7287492.1 hypothetical protein LMG7974_00371 [Campylobacter majalis]
MKAKFLALSVCACMFFVGCATNDSTKIAAGSCSVDVVSCDVNSVMGEYKATLPCADCGGIDVVLKLGVKEFIYNATYQGRDEKDMQTGTYSIDGNIITTTNLYKEIQKYKYANDKLIMLDSEGNEVQGVLADYYKFTKVK